MNEQRDIFPVGSVVKLYTDKQYYLIIALLVQTKQGDQEVYFEYEATILPWGLNSDQAVYFNTSDIETVVREGIIIEPATSNYLTEIKKWIRDNDDVAKGTTNLDVSK
ncbi:DUF4176 domain-containing protein [Latilactobacillus graminis]|uniref:DUF4176 domain-containing protein n=2 Tax=Latilactobacillus graminis TaxID=60519 RepID=A0AA89KX52_9LACO|nr:DUF4176 domain-containing protein [Latilactobacillus graminis]KRM22325.1 hypothetical protein FC90_GL000926 [Latilactobacillus graminis DSM 20719]QFP79500.1 DUF4176 domain-containing protein [Latilactobacillus graminis]